MKNFPKTNMPSILDREISDLTKDAFGHQHFAEGLRSLIESENNIPPFSIGLLGPWGTGKSTIKSLYLESLQNDRTTINGNQRNDYIFPVTFNAWRYGGEDIKRSLLRHVFLAIGGDELALRRQLYQQVSEVTQVRRSIWDILKEFLFQNCTTALIFLIILVLSLSLTVGLAFLIGIKNEGPLAWIVSLTIVLAGLIGKYVVDIRVKSPSLYNPITTIKFPLTSAEEYEQLLIQQLKTFKSSRDGGKCKRLVIFVDDLDRLSATEMVAGLDAIRAFLELPTHDVTNGPGVIFVISCDEDKVAEALANARVRQQNPDLPGSVFNRSDARRYLDRLFQFRLEILPFPRQDLRTYAKSKLQDMKELLWELEKKGVRIDELTERLIHVGVKSPRNALQIINAFAESWWIAVQRERKGVGSNDSGALHEGAVTNHPLPLAALCVLRVDFPDFFNHLQKRPEIINEINQVLFRKGNPDSLPLDAKLILKEYFVVEGDNITAEILPEHRAFRQYLSSLQGLRWPKRLKPLLLLAEDAITRRYGDKASTLYDAFVSGDTRGVIEVFGRELDHNNLSVEDVKLLEDLVEQVNQDTQIRRISAARVLADLAPRVPDECAVSLMTPLVRQLIDFKEVRMIIGPKRSKEIIRHTIVLDQQEVAAQFCYDLLHSQKLVWNLPSGETPNLDEITEIVLDAVDLVLDVRGKYNLPTKADSQLLSWLKSREVTIERQSESLPFSQLDNWVNESPDSLLFDLGIDYTDQAISEFQSNEVDLAVEGILWRIERVFDRLAKEGQESRTPLWEQLSRMVSVHSLEMVFKAYTIALRCSNLVEVAQANLFLTELSDRLLKEMNDPEQWGLNREEGAKSFLKLLAIWLNMVNSQTANNIAKLIIAWGHVNETSSFAVKGCRLLNQVYADVYNNVINEFANIAFGELPWEVRQELANELENLSDAQKTNLVFHLNNVVNTDNVTEEVAAEYVQFVQTTNVTAWKVSSLQQHITTLYLRLQKMFNNQYSYLAKIFPAGVALLGATSDGFVGQFITQLFSNAEGQTTAYPLLHKEMTGVWPKETDKTGVYNPDKIVDQAVTFIEKQPSLKENSYILESIVDLVERGVATENISSRVARAAVVVWPNSPKAVLGCINQLSGMFSPDDIKDILTGTQPSEEISQLNNLIEVITTKLNEDQIVTTTKEILSGQPVEIMAEPDGALVVWLDSLKSKASKVVDILLDIFDLNDSQKHRLYLYAVNHNDKFGIQFFIKALPRALKSHDFQKYFELAVNTSSEVAAIAISREEKATLRSLIIPTITGFSNGPFVTILRLIKQLNGIGALEKDADTINSLDDDQLSLVVKEFPSSKIFKKAMKDRNK